MLRPVSRYKSLLSLLPIPRLPSNCGFVPECIEMSCLEGYERLFKFLSVNYVFQERFIDILLTAAIVVTVLLISAEVWWQRFSG